MVGFKSNH